MKRLFNKLALGLLIGAIAAISAVSIMAQDDPEKTALYTKFTGCYKTKVMEEIAPCIAVGKEYLQKYGTPPDDYNKFVENQVAKLEARPKALRLEAAYTKFNNGIKNKLWRDTFDSGKLILAEEPDNIDVTLILATIAYDMAFNTTPADYTYKADGITYAKAAIQKIESGQVKTDNWGGGTYSYKTKDPALSRDNTLAWMNFTIGRLLADTNKEPTKSLAVLKEAAPYFYKSLQFNSDIKKFHTAYQALGRYYLEELNNTVDLYDKTCKNLTEDTDACKTMRGTQLAFAERGLDAYARAYKIAKDDPKQPQALKDILNKTVSQFYQARYKKTDGVNDYLAKVITQPLADPSSPIVPIVEEIPAATTTAPAGTTSTTPANTTVKPTTTPANTTKPGTTPANNTKPTTPAKPNGAKGTVAKKAPAKKKAGR